MIVDGELAEDRLAGIAAACLGGVDAVLLRDRSADSSRLLATAAHLRRITREHGARMLVHTHAGIARAVGADGVHAAEADMEEIPTMRAWLADDACMFSASCHSPESLRHAAVLGADFAFLSPVFPTISHPDAEPLGVERFTAMARQAPLPVLALGGITPENRRLLSGFGVAVIRAILDAEDPEAAARGLADR